MLVVGCWLLVVAQTRHRAQRVTITATDVPDAESRAECRDASHRELRPQSVVGLHLNWGGCLISADFYHEIMFCMISAPCRNQGLKSKVRFLGNHDEITKVRGGVRVIT